MQLFIQSAGATSTVDVAPTDTIASLGGRRAGAAERVPRHRQGRDEEQVVARGQAAAAAEPDAAADAAPRRRRLAHRQEVQEGVPEVTLAPPPLMLLPALA